MAKYYKRKTLSSLDELDLEQAKIRKAYHSIEHHFLESLFQPEKLAFAVGSRLIKSLAAQKECTAQGPGSKSGKLPLFSARPGIGLRNPFFKKIARSWIRWQAFNLAFLMGKKAVKYFEERRRHKTKKC